MRLITIFSKRIALTIRTQADRSLKVIHFLKVSHPARIDESQHNLRFDIGKWSTNLLCLRIEETLEIFNQTIDKRIHVVVMIDRIYSEILNARHLDNPFVKRVQIPIIARLLGGTPLQNMRFYDVFNDLRHAIGKVFAVKDGITLCIDCFTLQVHYVVVFKNMLTCSKVGCFNLTLRGFNCLRNHRCLNRHIVGHVGFFHHATNRIHARAAKQTHKVVFERKVELRCARVALTTGTTTQLVVDTARLMTLSTNYAQATCSKNLFGFTIGNGLGLSFGLLHLGRRRLLIFAKSFKKHSLRHSFGVAAQQDVSTTTSHVRSNGNRTSSTRLSDDGGFAFVILSIQYFMFDATLGKQTT